MTTSRIRDFYDYTPNPERDRANAEEFLDGQFPDLKTLRELRCLQGEERAHLEAIERDCNSGQAIEILRGRVAAGVAARQTQINALEANGHFPRS